MMRMMRMTKYLITKYVHLSFFKKLASTSSDIPFICKKHFNYAREIEGEAEILAETTKAIKIKLGYYLFNDNNIYFIKLWIPKRDIDAYGVIHNYLEEGKHAGGKNNT